MLTYPDHDPRFAAALARAYNDWLHDFCRTDPSRLLGAGMISVYDINDAVEETSGRGRIWLSLRVSTLEFGQRQELV